MPIHCQKRLRLQEAKLLRAKQIYDVEGVGYISGSQFNREYRRLFGMPRSRMQCRCEC